MGNDASNPKANVDGDNDLTIIQTQNVHSEQHETHELKLNIVLILLAIILMQKVIKTIFKILKTLAKRDAINNIQLPI